MRSHNGRTRLYGHLTLVAALGAIAAQAQITLDWPTQKFASPPVVDKTTAVTVTVSNVNDLLYQYKIDFTATPRTLDDAASLFSLQNAAGAAAKNAAGAPAPTPCTGNVAKLNNSVSTIAKGMLDLLDPANKKDAQGKPRSVPLQETVDGWGSQVKKPWNEQVLAPSSAEGGSIASVQAFCTGDEAPLGQAAVANAMALGLKIDAEQKKVDAVHQAVQTTTLAPETDYTITVTESFDNTTTKTFTAKFSPQSHILTLSLGALLSGIQQRSYSNSKDPGNTQQNLLAVNGTGRFSPLGVALLNYQIPGVGNDNIGLALSSGLVLRFGNGDVSASALGWFGGPSVHLYHRLFLSAGVHIGQFSDFPLGLHTGSVIPANYGDLNGINRTTARFAFAVTYQTKQFNVGSQAPKTNSTTGTAAGPSGASGGAGGGGGSNKAKNGQ
jgi:hypothetical protein